jgi:hypothetical protein
LWDQVRKDPDGLHYVIAHSHGGNIAMYALRDTRLASQIAGIITLSTPFLVAQDRDLSFIGKIALWTLAAAIAIAPSGYILWRMWPLYNLDHPTFFFVGSNLIENALGLISVCIALLVGIAISNYIESFRKSLILPALDRDKLLVIRGPADEANALLVTSQLIELLITSFWGKRGRLDSIIRRLKIAFKRAQKRRWRKTWWWKFFRPWIVVDLYLGNFLGIVFIIIGSAIAVFAPTWLVKTLTSPTGYAYWEIALGLAFAAVRAPFIVGFYGVILAVAILFGVGAILGVVVFPALLVLMFVMIPVVPELGPLAAIIAISIEPSPPGQFTIEQIHAGGKQWRSAFKHSITYSHPDALRAMADWMIGKLSLESRLLGRIG